MQRIRFVQSAHRPILKIVGQALDDELNLADDNGITVIPRDRYEVVLTDENIEAIDFDLKADLVGISAMTSYVNRGYEIADQFRAKGVPVIMGGVHPSFLPHEALKHQRLPATPLGESRGPGSGRAAGS